MAAGTIRRDLAATLEDPVDLSAAPGWWWLVLEHGAPLGAIELPSPGPSASPALVEAAVARHVDERRVRDRLRAELNERIGTRERAFEPLSLSVVLCTHRRSAYLPAALDALSQLSPAPAQVVIVDNDPGLLDCRELVRRHGFDYVREDRRGLDHARNTGARVTQGDVVVFTDDDCVPPPCWLAPLPEAFASAATGVVTGPAFPYALDTASQVRMESKASLGRGFHRRVFDWTNIQVAHAGVIGVGANMAFRRELLDELGPAPFAPELDAGTVTESGGDAYVLARALAIGHRVVYEPRMFTFHRHRSDPAALHRAVRGYGVGLASVMCKLLIEDRELGAWRGFAWVLAQYMQTQRRRAVGRADAVETRLAWNYVAGAFAGPGRWWRSRREQRRLAVDAPAHPVAAVVQREVAGEAEGETARGAEPLPNPGSTCEHSGNTLDRVEISVVIPTRGREAALRRCLDGLTAQTVDPGRYEVLVVDDSSPPGLDTRALARDHLRVSVHRSDGRGASAARNLGAALASAELVLFLDDDVLPDPQLLEHHLSGHPGCERPRAVVGNCPPVMRKRGLMASLGAFWWSDTLDEIAGAAAPTFTLLLSGNVSVPRRAFVELGGFSGEVLRREDWDFGLRWLGAGFELAFEPRARARHDYELGTAARLRGIEHEGLGDAILSRRYDGVISSLPLADIKPESSVTALRRAGLRAWRLPGSRAAALAALGLLESAKLRMPWLRVASFAHRASYRDGLRQAGDGSARRAGETSAGCELLSDAPLCPRGPVAPTLDVMLGGAHVASVRPRDGLWTPQVAQQIVDSLSARQLEQIGIQRGWIPADEARDTDEIEVIALEKCADPCAWWQAAAAAASGAGRSICALLLPGVVEVGGGWLAEAAVAFDGAAVGAAFGGALDDSRAPQPLYLHRSDLLPRLDVVHAPAYLVLRTGLLEELGGVPAELAHRGVLAPAAALVASVLARGSLVARRDVRGLRRDGGDLSFEIGRAWGAAVARYERPRRTAIRRGALVLGAEAARQARRARFDPRPLKAAAGAAIVLAGLLRRGSSEVAGAAGSR